MAAEPTVRTQVNLLTEQVGQLRRAFGFNGKLDDPEAEAIVRETFIEMRDLAKERRRSIDKHKAWAVVLEDIASRFGFLFPLRQKVAWALGAIVASVMWQLGPIVFHALGFAIKAIEHPAG